MLKRILIFLCLTLLASPGFAEAIPRTIVALYDSKEFASPQQTVIHRFAEMPLNHLGLTVEYHDIRKTLPELKDRADVRGVITWFRSDHPAPDVTAYMRWIETSVAQGKKFVILGIPGFVYDKWRKPKLYKPANQVLQLFGLRYVSCGWFDCQINRLAKLLKTTRIDRGWVGKTRNSEYITKDARMVEFEHKLEPKPPYNAYRAEGDRTVAYLTARQAGQPATDSVLVSISPAGGFVDSAYAAYTFWDAKTKKTKAAWIINPFLFFATAFATDDLPKPDTTTLAGRRIFYRHIDGDGWNNTMEIKDKISAQSILDETILPYPDLPVTVAPIAGDLDPIWAGTEKSQAIARTMFALPQVEVASHTYSHPNDWSFFRNDTPDNEKPFLSRYYYGAWDGSKGDVKAGKPYVDHIHSDLPRAYATERFNLDKEISGSKQFISTLLPPGKQVRMLMWSGNTTPWEDVIRRTRTEGMWNINGGDSRFDTQFPSYAWVAPIGKPVGAERQIYASSSNENTYAHVANAPYDGFKALSETLERTESPIRVKPFNLYHHIFSADHRGSLDALRGLLDYARAAYIIPIEASRFTAITHGFYGAHLIKTGVNSWEVRGRGSLQTIRFDKGQSKHVDFRASRGIVGQMHYQDALYVYLDEAVQIPVIVLANLLTSPPAPYLIDSRWRVWNLQSEASALRFTIQGYGKGTMRWKVPEHGTYTLTTIDENGKTLPLAIAETQDGIATFPIEKDAIAPLAVRMTWTVTNAPKPKSPILTPDY